MTTSDPKPPRVSHEGGRSVWKVAADTARLVALSTSQVLRKLDNSTLSIDEDPAGRGTPSVRHNQGMPGGGRNPYESRPTHRAPAARGRDLHRGASPTVATKSRSPAPARERASWWSRLFRRG